MYTETRKKENVGRGGAGPGFEKERESCSERQGYGLGSDIRQAKWNTAIIGRLPRSCLMKLTSRWWEITLPNSNFHVNFLHFGLSCINKLTILIKKGKLTILIKRGTLEKKGLFAWYGGWHTGRKQFIVSILLILVTRIRLTVEQDSLRLRQPDVRRKIWGVCGRGIRKGRGRVTWARRLIKSREWKENFFCGAISFHVSAYFARYT